MVDASRVQRFSEVSRSTIHTEFGFRDDEHLLDLLLFLLLLPFGISRSSQGVHQEL